MMEGADGRQILAAGEAEGVADQRARSGMLAGVELFEGLSSAALRAIEQSCTVKRFAANELIIDRGSLSRDVMFILTGQARVLNYSVTGREITFDDLKPGHCFGEIAAIDGQPRSAAVVAATDTAVASLPYQKFLDVLDRQPCVAVRVMRRLARIIRASDERIMDLSTLAAQNRVHAELLRQGRAGSSDGVTARITPIPVHSDIASRVSTTRETVARVMNDLARKGIVKRTKTTLIIQDIRRLESMVEEVRG